jgi:hypothetical protein
MFKFEATWKRITDFCRVFLMHLEFSKFLGFEHPEGEITVTSGKAFVITFKPVGGF